MKHIRHPSTLRRVPQRRRNQRAAAVHTFSAPTRGWVTDENLAAETKAGALRLENLFPETDGIRVRGGSPKHATITNTNGVRSLIPYSTASLQKLFATSDAALYDVTTPADPDVSPSAEFTGLSAGYFSYQQFETAGGDYLYIANDSASDDLYLFDGSTWQAVNGASPPVSITGVTTADLSAVWAYRNRLFFVEQGTMNAWYLPVGSIGGAASDLSLAGVFQRGGYLLFGATWSLDAGDGIDDKCVFVSSEGEVAVYEGGNPGDANDWRLVGRYDIGKPLGKRGFMRAGGDLIILTQDGAVPISEALRLDVAALKFHAVSEPIGPDWRQEGVDRADQPWEMVKWPSKNLGLVSLPVGVAGQEEHCYAVNLLTGAWAKYTGWNATSLAYLDDQVYFGDDDGYVRRAEESGYDLGASYIATYVGLFSSLNAPTMLKTAQLMRGVYAESSSFNPGYSISTDYTISLPPAPSAEAVVGDAKWDVAKWDEDYWDGGYEQQVSLGWRSVFGAGFSLAPQIRITVGATPTPNIKLIALDLAYEVGEVVV